MPYWKYSTVYSPRTKRSWVTAGSLQQRHIHRSPRPDQSHDAHENPSPDPIVINPFTQYRWKQAKLLALDRHADFLSVPFALIAAISIGPRLNSPLPAFLVKSRR